MKIVVLAGGYSPERAVSLASGALIANALAERGHRVLLLDAYKGISELSKDPEEWFQTESYPLPKISDAIPDLSALKEACGNGDALLGKNVIRVCRAADKVFLALHGGMGENGQLQATLDTYGISYTGSGHLGSAVAMDKDLSKRLFQVCGVPTPRWVYLDLENTDCLPTVLREIGLPCVVKPCDCGSSVGVSMANTAEELQLALQEAAKWGSHVLVEERVFGRELTVGILDGRVLPPVEIVPLSGFYDYKNKYQGTTREICPAELSTETMTRLGELSLRAFSALRLHGYARFDYLMDREERLWCLEANTLPGMTPTSLLPLAAQTAGISYGELCDKIAHL